MTFFLFGWAHTLSLSNSKTDSRIWVKKSVLIKKKHEKDDKRFSCIIQYSPLGKQLENVVRKHWPILSSDSTLNNASFREPPHFVYKRPNIRDLDVRADQPHISPSKNIFRFQMIIIGAHIAISFTNAPLATIHPLG